MQYLITFLEGFISFISPCMLPMLPMYVSYFSRQDGEDGKGRTANTFFRALAFVVGFSIVFIALGLVSGTVGSLLIKYRTVVNIVSGLIVVIFGLGYLEVIRLPFLSGFKQAVEVRSIFSAFLFGLVFSVSLTPCVGAFLGSALMMASSSANMLTGMLLLVCYSLGLGIPFLVSAMLLEKLSGAFGFIKKHYKLVNRICGAFLILTGILMMTGLMTRLLGAFM